MVRLRIGHYQCCASPVLLAAFVVLLCFFICLSIWQQQRAITKIKLFTQIDQFQALSQMTDLSLPELISEFHQLGQGISDARLVINGHFLETPVLYLDNKTTRGIAGYQVLAFFAIDNSNTRILINLGWLPMHNQRRTPLPSVQLSTGNTQLVGKIFVPQTNEFHLGDQMFEENKRLLQWIDLPRIAMEKQIPLHPFILRLTNSSVPVSPQEFDRNWPDRKSVGISPEKHIGYAIQWALFALILVSIWIKTQWKKTL